LKEYRPDFITHIEGTKITQGTIKIPLWIVKNFDKNPTTDYKLN